MKKVGLLIAFLFSFASAFSQVYQVNPAYGYRNKRSIDDSVYHPPYIANKSVVLTNQNRPALAFWQSDNALWIATGNTSYLYKVLDTRDTALVDSMISAFVQNVANNTGVNSFNGEDGAISFNVFGGLFLSNAGSNFSLHNSGVWGLNGYGGDSVNIVAGYGGKVDTSNYTIIVGVDTLVIPTYHDVDSMIADAIAAGVGNNMANADLTLTGNRIHSGDNLYRWRYENGTEVSFQTDVFQVENATGVSRIFTQAEKVAIGDVDNVGNGTSIVVNDGSETTALTQDRLIVSATGIGEMIGVVPFRVRIGDNGNAGNSTKIEVNDSLKKIDLNADEVNVSTDINVGNDMNVTGNSGFNGTVFYIPNIPTNTSNTYDLTVWDQPTKRFEKIPSLPYSFLSGTPSIVNSINTLSGGLTFAAGTGIGLNIVGSTFTYVNNGVTSLNGSAGAITGVWTNFGNNFGSNPSIGTSNNTSMFFMSNGINRARMAETGEWVFGANTISAGYSFQVKGYTGSAYLFQNTQNQSSGSNTSIEFNPLITQSGTAGYTAHLVNATESSVGSGTNYLYRGQTNGIDRIRIRATGLMEGAGLGNLTSSSNALIGVGSSGVQVSRNIADAQPSLLVSLLHASSTGNIANFANSGGIVAAIGKTGWGSFGNSTAPVGSMLNFRANPTTTKVAAAGGKLKEFYSSAGSVSTSETDIFSYTTEADILNTAGDVIKAEYSGTVTKSNLGSDFRKIKVYFGGNVVFDSGDMTIGTQCSWKLEVTIIRTGTTRPVITTTLLVSGHPTYTLVNTVAPVITYTSTNILKITGTSIGASTLDNDIQGLMGAVYYFPVSQ